MKYDQRLTIGKNNIKFELTRCRPFGMHRRIRRAGAEAQFRLDWVAGRVPPPGQRARTPHAKHRRAGSAHAPGSSGEGQIEQSSPSPRRRVAALVPPPLSRLGRETPGDRGGCDVRSCWSRLRACLPASRPSGQPGVASEDGYTSAADASSGIAGRATPSPSRIPRPARAPSRHRRVPRPPPHRRRPLPRRPRVRPRRSPRAVCPSRRGCGRRRTSRSSPP